MGEGRAMGAGITWETTDHAHHPVREKGEKEREKIIVGKKT